MHSCKSGLKFEFIEAPHSILVGVGVADVNEPWFAKGEALKNELNAVITCEQRVGNKTRFVEWTKIDSEGKKAHHLHKVQESKEAAKAGWKTQKCWLVSCVALQKPSH